MMNSLVEPGLAEAASLRGLDIFGLDLRFAGGGRGNGFAGAAWRGLLGQALCGAVCPFPAPACATCPSAAGCAYPELFKPVHESLLAPFWLHGWRRSQAGWVLGIRWLGAGHAPAVGEWLAALGRAGAGLAFGGASTTLVGAEAAGSRSSAWTPAQGLRLPLRPLALSDPGSPPAACRVRFVTPLVSKHAGDPLFGPLHTRLQRLVRQHGDGSPLPRPAQPWRCRVAASKAVRIPLARRVLAGALLDLELDEIDPDAWRMLCAGQELHAGGQAGMGCGQYRIETV